MFWKDKRVIDRLKTTANYIIETGIEKNIKIVLVDSNDNSEMEIN